ncbi:hypothetical protein DER29_5962 [Micromonospora sp. M71_S20]|uniref:hypothetical protein n=1 Tax=Micromonospora sp. M71_S20 TaxID=592872 RepID=UPI000EB29107|nr:hypothetical protein [Micromonospora sp. M71_S20]RLK12678.1 hypothetical protein DER29_5962 [Micromonospora sp. M71_S20]
MPTRSPDPDVVNHVEAAALLGISVSHLHRLYRERSTTGFPERTADGRTWNREDIARYEPPSNRIRRSTQASIDRTGDPNELVDVATAARILGYTNRSALHGNNPVWLRLKECPDESSASAGGRTRRRWKRETVWKIAEDRVGRGGAESTGRPIGSPHGHPDRTGDPDELVGKAEAARILGYNHPNALPTPVLDRADEQNTGPAGRRRLKWRRATLWTILDQRTN